MKKYLLTLIVLLMALVLCACSDETPTEPSESIKNTENVGIVDPTAHTHVYQAVQKSPTCQEDGSVTYYCSCGENYSEPLYAIGHALGNLIITERPSMTKTGEGKRVCSSCGEEVFESVPVNTLEQEVQSFIDDYLLEFPRFESADQLSGGIVFGWVTWHIPKVSWEMDENYLITIVYSMDDIDAFTQKYLGRTYDYSYLAEPNKDYMTFDFDKRQITVVTGGMGGGGYLYTIETLTENADGSYSVRYLAVDPYTENAFELGYYHYGNLRFKIVDGHMRVIAHTVEAK